MGCEAIVSVHWSSRQDVQSEVSVPESATGGADAGSVREFNYYRCYLTGRTLRGLPHCGGFDAQ